MNKPTDDLFAPLIEAERDRLRAAGWTQHPTRPDWWVKPDGVTIKHEEAALRTLDNTTP